MLTLYNSQGRHIANFVSGYLYAASGEHIGRYLEGEGIFVDLHGRYLGEIVAQNRLMYKPSSPYRTTNFGSVGYLGSIGNYGNPGGAIVYDRLFRCLNKPQAGISGSGKRGAGQATQLCRNHIVV